MSVRSNPMLVVSAIGVGALVVAPLVLRPSRTVMSFVAAAAGLAAAMGVFAPWFSEIHEGSNIGPARLDPWCCWSGVQPPFHGYYATWAALVGSVLSAATAWRPGAPIAKTRVLAIGAILSFVVGSSVAVFHAIRYPGLEFEPLTYYEIEFGLPLTIALLAAAFSWSAAVLVGVQGEVRRTRRSVARASTLNRTPLP